MPSSELLALLFTAISGLFAFAMWIWKKLIKPTQKFVEEVKQCQEEVRESIKIIRSEVVTNGGSSIKDAVDSLKGTCERIEERQQVLDQRSKASLHYHDEALFETDDIGHITWFNERFKKLIDNEDLKGYDWLSIMAENKRESFIKEFASCLEMSRKLDFETEDTNDNPISFVGYPYKINDKTHRGFLIHVSFLGEA